MHCITAEMIAVVWERANPSVSRGTAGGQIICKAALMDEDVLAVVGLQRRFRSPPGLQHTRTG